MRFNNWFNLILFNSPQTTCFLSVDRSWVRTGQHFVFISFGGRAAPHSVNVCLLSSCSFLPYLDWWVPGKGCGQEDTCAIGHRKPGHHSSCCWSWSHQYSAEREQKKGRKSMNTAWCHKQPNVDITHSNVNELKVPTTWMRALTAYWQHGQDMKKPIKS